MKCSVICVGTEINLGIILNTNAKYISENLTKLGIECNFIHVVRDNQEEISLILKESLKNSDFVIISGGLGPTDDDVTRSAVASALCRKLIRNRSLDVFSLKFIKQKKSKYIKEGLLRQSYIPSDSIPIKPKIGSASGFIVNLKPKHKWIFCIPGVPKEMKDMFEEAVIPYIDRVIKDKSKDNLVIRKTELMTTDISESEIEQKISKIKRKAEKINVEITITATPGLIRIILISKSFDEDICKSNLKKIEEKICKVLGDFVYSIGDIPISEILKRTIIKKKKNITISTAESMTGGLISSIITEAPGSSKYFLGGIVSYSNFAKVRLLKINNNNLEKYGAVSKKICVSMAKSAKKIFNSDFSLSITGFAGSQADDGNNKTGLVYCCILDPDENIQIFEKKFVGSRSEIRFRASQFILNKLRITVEEKIS